MQRWLGDRAPFAFGMHRGELRLKFQTQSRDRRRGVGGPYKGHPATGPAIMHAACMHSPLCVDGVLCAKGCARGPGGWIYGGELTPLSNTPGWPYVVLQLRATVPFSKTSGHGHPTTIATPPTPNSPPYCRFLLLLRGPYLPSSHPNYG